MKAIRNLLVWAAWKLGLMNVPWWDDARIWEYEEEAAAALPEQEEAPVMLAGEPLRAALADAASAGRW